MSKSSTSSTSSTSSDESDSENQTLSDFINFKNKVIGNYHLFHLLGKGGYAQVWLAYNHIKNNFYALKIQHPYHFDYAKEEIKILKKIEKLPYKIEVIENFIFSVDNNKYYVIVFPVYGSNLEDLSRLSIFEDGFGKSIVKKFTKQTLQNLTILHDKCHLIHCDIKPDNFLLSEPDHKIKKLMETYNTKKFNEIYQKVLEKTPEIIDNKNKDIIAREKIHYEIVKKINFKRIMSTIITNDELLTQLKKSDFLISDFGEFCDIEDKYNEDFGTSHYRSPENILVSEDLDYTSDIWSLGCTIYELLTNKLLFEPIKCKNFSRDQYHLSEILQLGNFSNKEIKSFQRKKEFFYKDRSLKKLPKTDIVVDKINLIKSSFWKGFILSMLTVSYKKRPSSKFLLDQLKSEQ